MHSIRVKIAAITIVAIITSVLSVVGAGFFTIRAENDRHSAVEMSLLSKNVQKTLDDYFESIEQSVEMAAIFASENLSGIALVEGGVAGSYARKANRTPEQAEKLDAYLAEYVRRVQEACSSVAGHTHGIVTYYYCISPEISLTQHGFFYSKVGKTGFMEQPQLDARELDPEDIEHTTWYYTPIRSGRPVWVGPYLAHFLGEMLTISYLAPVYKSGTFIGVLGMDIPFDTIVEQIKPVRVYKTGFACLLDENGKVLYHPNIPFGGAPDISDNTIYDRMLMEEDDGEAPIRYQVGGEQRQMSFSTLCNGMKLVVTAPLHEINESWTRLSTVIMLATAAIVVLFAAGMMLGLRILTRPLQRLTSASRRLAAGDYDVELAYHGKDEVGQLTRAFGQMRDHMKLYIADLNRRIHTDDLTGLPNMTYFFQLAEAERVRMLEADQRPAMLYFDLIGMKYFNRQYGFSEGNQLICAVGQILLGEYGDRRCSRFGQDHFAVIADEARLKEQLGTVFAACRNANGGRSLPVRVGVYPDRMEAVDVSVACDRAKFACDRHRGTYDSDYYYFDKSMLSQAENTRYIINSLDRALSEGWVQVYYQPIVRAANGRVCDEEALARWIDPAKGLLSPGEFIPVLEGARLIHKLDLYVLDQILLKLKNQEQAGFYTVPQSLNLSRVDFDALDIVEEIRRRVDESGIAREKLTIEVTESAVGSDFEFIKAQVDRFRELGFQVWMDDFGSGYSSLDVLQNIHFDLIKFDMRFMQRFSEGDESKIILTELIKMAIALGIETVAEGVETGEQVDFLREVGCTKLQGYYYCKPIPFEEIMARYKKGVQIGFENPDETGYYTAIGRINLYDLGAVSNDEGENLNAFDTLPMAIIESDGEGCTIVRTNKTYRAFARRAFGGIELSRRVPYAAVAGKPGSAFMLAVKQCGENGQRAFINELLPDDTSVHALVRRIAVNPVTGIAACAVAVLGIADDSASGVSYSRVAQALSTDYINLYCVNVANGRFVEYSSAPGKEALSVENHGEDFFAESVRQAPERVYEGDLEAFLRAFTKENVLGAIDAHGAFTLTYRLMVDGEPKYVNMKAVRMSENSDHVIIGVNDVDAQMKQSEALERMRDEQITYARISALAGNYICIYTVDPRTGRYSEYSANSDYDTLGLAKTGEDFFADAYRQCADAVCADDLDRFRASFTRENVLNVIRDHGIYTFCYRLMIDGAPVPASVRAAMVEERDGAQIVVGVYRV